MGVGWCVVGLVVVVAAAGLTSDPFLDNLVGRASK